MVVATNLRSLKRGRSPKAGDVFTWTFDEVTYRFGLTVRADLAGAARTPFTGAHLVYFYSFSSTDDRMPSVELFAGSQLLIPPQFTNQLGWTTGLFKKVGSVPDPERFLRREWAFYDPQERVWRDVDGAPTREGKHKARWTVALPGAVDDKLSEALGRPLKTQLGFPV